MGFGAVPWDSERLPRMVGGSGEKMDLVRLSNSINAYQTRTEAVRI